MNKNYLLIGICLSFFFSVCQKQPNIDPAVAGLIFQAETAFRNGYYNAALAITDSSLVNSPHSADIHFLRGRIFTKLARLDDAEAAYRTVLSLNPGYQGAWFNMGTNSIRQDDQPAAIAHYKSEMLQFPSARTMVQIGRAYADLGKIDSAEIAYEDAIKTDNKNAAAYMRLGHLYKDRGDIKKAIEYATVGLDLDPENLDYKYIIGSLLLLNEEPKASLPFFQTVTSKRPWHYWAHHNLGQALYRIGNETQGQYYMDTAKDLQKGIQEVENWRNLANMNPDQLMLWVNLGNSLKNMRRVQEAKDAFLVALSISPMSFALQNNIANLCLMEGDTIQAINRYKAILSFDSTLVDIWLNLGVVHVNSGRKNDARQAWMKGLEYDPHNTTLKDYLETLN